METNCPQCSQILRVADHLRNPLLRCPRCQTQFRLGTADPTPEKRSVLGSSRQAATPAPSPSAFDNSSLRRNEPAAERATVATKENDDSELRDFLANQRQKGGSVAKKSVSWNKGGFGWAGMVVLFLLIKGGPRLAKHLFREQKPQAAPVQMNEEQRQALQRMMRDLQQKRAAEQANPLQAAEAAP